MKRYLIQYPRRGHGDTRWAEYKSLEDASIVANEIFRETGIVVAIEERETGAHVGGDEDNG